jgi:cytochrome c biogenesis protein CcmG/thiol:disulfide interchange protein DsbE
VTGRRPVPLRTMRRLAVPGLITLIAVALLAVLAFGVSHSGPSNALASEVSRGERPAAPKANMALPVLGSAKRKVLADYRGKIVLLNVFAGWCSSCQLEAGLLAKAQKTLSVHDGTILGVTYQDSTSDAESYMSQYHLAFPVLRDPTGDFSSSYGVNGIPETFIIGPTGHVLEACASQLTSQWLSKALANALDGAGVTADKQLPSPC